MAHSISVIIPCYNGAATIEKCLVAVFASKYSTFEVIVVDDCSEDDSVAIIKQFPCRLIALEKRTGAAQARNIGAEQSRGDILFFTDADCVLEKDTLANAAIFLASSGVDTIVGGTYTKKPYDQGFFNSFQSIFIHYSETKNCADPDYLATHGLVITRALFKKSGGFPADFMPILEDVEFSHRMKKMGYQLRINPHLLVRHIFNYSLSKSIRNAIIKSTFWTLYSLRNKDLTADSGTASIELKINVVTLFLVLALIITACSISNFALIYIAVLLLCVNMYISRNLLQLFYETEGFLYLIKALIYYLLIYPIAVSIGSVRGMLLYAAGKYK
jgi:glycosyltransferase involved in cell wall biosynthesis